MCVGFCVNHFLGKCFADIWDNEILACVGKLRKNAYFIICMHVGCINAFLSRGCLVYTYLGFRVMVTQILMQSHINMLLLYNILRIFLYFGAMAGISLFWLTLVLLAKL